MHAVQDKPLVPRLRGQGDEVRELGHGRLFAEHVQAGGLGLADQRRMAARRRADIDEIQPFPREHLGRIGVEARIGKYRRQGRAAFLKRVGGGHYVDAGTAQPSGQVPLGGDVAETDEGATQSHPRY